MKAGAVASVTKRLHNPAAIHCTRYNGNIIRPFNQIDYNITYFQVMLIFRFLENIVVINSHVQIAHCSFS